MQYNTVIARMKHYNITVKHWPPNLFDLIAAFLLYLGMFHEEKKRPAQRCGCRFSARYEEVIGYFQKSLFWPAKRTYMYM